MKILLTVDPEIPVPPKLYGGIERIADGLISAYAQEGHEVYLLAHEESASNSASKIIGWKGKKSSGTTAILKNSLQLTSWYNKINPDVIHSFSRLLYTYPLLLSKKPLIVQSYQRRISRKSTSIAKRIGKEKLHFTACAYHLYKNFEDLKSWSTIYNFTDTRFFQPDATVKQNYLFYLGRIEEIKGTGEAIELALKTKNKLIIAGNIPKEHQKYFDRVVKPYLNNPLIQYVGPVNDEQKRKYLQGAKAMLFPIKWEEPFGIVMAESMACGTPVIGFARGSVNEVVVDGLNGYKVNNLPEMIEAVNKLHYISRERTREYAEKRFDLRVIAQQYLNLFETIIHERASTAV